MSEPIREVVDALYLEEIRRAREMSAEEKLRLGGDLFDEMCERMRCGIRSEFPEADESRVEEILEQRLALARRLEHAA
jgi:hypothetical protein